MQICQNKCVDNGRPNFPYIHGYKWCKRCYIWIKTEDIKCSCCRSGLRNGSHMRKFKTPKPRIK